MPQSQIKIPFLGRFFRRPVDFYELLNKHAAKAVDAMIELHAWMESGANEHSQLVVDLERQADQIKMDLQVKLGAIFITPFDREDIYDLSVILDEVINGAKQVVREMEAMEVSPCNETLKQMAEILLEGTRCLQHSIAGLKDHQREAANQAFLARKAENRFVKVYRQATHELFAMDDVKTILKTHEVYRYMLDTAENIDNLGEKLIHVLIKIA